MIVEFDKSTLTEDRILGTKDLNWMLTGITKEDGKPDFDIPISLNGEVRKVNIARFAELWQLITEPATRHYGDKDVLLGISQTLFGRYIGPTGMTYGMNGSWEQLNWFRVEVEGTYAKVTANYSLMAYDRKARHPDHPEDQTIIWETTTLDKVTRLRLFNLVAAYSVNRQVPISYANLDYTLYIDALNKKAHFEFTSEGAPEVNNHDEVA